MRTMTLIALGLALGVAAVCLAVGVYVKAQASHRARSTVRFHRKAAKR